MIIEFVVFVALVIFALFDLKEKAVPAFATTAVILLLLVVKPENLLWGIAAFVFGFVLYELNFSNVQFFGGIADIKVITIIGLIITNLEQFALLMLSTGIVAIMYAAVLHIKYKEKVPKEVPFIPALLIVYVIIIFIKL